METIIELNLKNYKNYGFKPINLKTGSEDRPVILDFLPDPLHVTILGTPIDALDKLEILHQEEMNQFYSKYDFEVSCHFSSLCFILQNYRYQLQKYQWGILGSCSLQFKKT